MEFRRSGQRDDRRRRVLREENLGTSGETEEAVPARTRKGSGSVSGRSYSDDALHERQPRVVDLLPTRAWTISVLVLLGLTFVAALATLHLFLPELAQLAGRKNLMAFDLAGPNSVACWLSSLLFALAAGAGLLVYSLRRYKVDDYRGRYRAWLPASAALFLLSIDATAGWTQLVASTLVRVSNVQGFGDVSIFRVGLYLLLFATVGVRMAIEMRRSKAASLTFLVAAASYGVSVPLWLGVWVANDAVLGALARSVIALLGHIAVTTSVTLYARYVYLDAQGKLSVRNAKAKKVKKPKSTLVDEEADDDKPAATKTNGAVRRIDAAHKEAPAPKSAQPATSSTTAPTRPAGPLAAKLTAAATSSNRFGDPAQVKAAATVSRNAPSDDDDDEEDDDGDESSRLSKAERKRLKKMQRRGKF